MPDGQRRPGYRDVQPVTDLVTDEECYEAMQYLDRIAHDFAVAYAEVDFQQYMLRQVEALGVVFSDEKAAANRLYESRASDPYDKAIKRLRDAQVAHKEIEAKRDAAKLKVEVWRTVHADKRSRDVPEPGRR